MSRTPLPYFVRAIGALLWQAPLIAVPFALFFALLTADNAAGLGRTYLASLAFSLSIQAAFVATRVLAPAAPTQRVPQGRATWAWIAKGAGPILLGSVVAAIIIELWIIPGFLRGSRQIAVVAAFTGLFTLLGLSVYFALTFYRRALDSARAEQELSVARRMQGSFLLSTFPVMPRLEVYAINIPSREVSGDFYDVVEGTDGGGVFLVVDVAGKGVGAALLAGMLQAAARTLADAGASLEELAVRLNTVVRRGRSRAQFATVFLAQVDAEATRLRYLNAGHNPPMLVRGSGALVWLDARNVAIGLMNAPTFTATDLELQPGDRLFCYTDGVVEARSASGEELGDVRLRRLLEQLPPDQTASAQAHAVIQAVQTFTSPAEPHDDVTVLVLRRM